MHKELEVMKPRCNGLWKRGVGTAALIYFWILTNVPVVALAKSEKGKSDATDTGVTEVTDGINVIKDLVLGCVGGVGVIFLNGLEKDQGMILDFRGGIIFYGRG